MNNKKSKKKKEFTELDLKGNFIENTFISRPIDKLKSKYPDIDETLINEILDEVSRNVDEADIILKEIANKKSGNNSEEFSNIQKSYKENADDNDKKYDINHYDNDDLLNNNIKHTSVDTIVDGEIININEYIMTYCFSDEDESKIIFIRY